MADLLTTNHTRAGRPTEEDVRGALSAP
jgi:hypothetical protein